MDGIFVCVCVCVCSPARAKSNVLVGWSKRYWGIIPTLLSHCSHLYQQDTAGQIWKQYAQTQPSPVAQTDSGIDFACLRTFSRPRISVRIFFFFLLLLSNQTATHPTAASQFRNNLHVTDGMSCDTGPDQACTHFPQWPVRMTPSTDSGWVGRNLKFQTCVCECKCGLCVRALCAWHSSPSH